MHAGAQPERSGFQCRKAGSGGECKEENPLIQHNAHNRQVSPQWIDRRKAPGRNLSIAESGTGASLHHHRGRRFPAGRRSSSAVRRGLLETSSPPIPSFPPRPTPIPPSVRIQTMSDWEQPWSNSSTAPPISKHNYNAEKAMLAGSFICSVLYGTPPPTRSLFALTSIVRFILGVLAVLFFQCMAALLNPTHRREEGIKRWLVFYTVAMFLFVTVYTAANLHIQSISFIDNRQDVPAYSPHSSGPLNYQYDVRGTSLGLIPNVMFNLNNWLADGLLVSSLSDAALTHPGV